YGPINAHLGTLREGFNLGPGAPSLSEVWLLPSAPPAWVSQGLQPRPLTLSLSTPDAGRQYLARLLQCLPRLLTRCAAPASPSVKAGGCALLPPLGCCVPGQGLQPLRPPLPLLWRLGRDTLSLLLFSCGGWLGRAGHPPARLLLSLIHGQRLSSLAAPDLKLAIVLLSAASTRLTGREATPFSLPFLHLKW
ncbi:hypothetical protein L7F22_002091, partial [Adiantum nelumboides]|nr:hypothetical protein [Adiantum nelumboides]